LKIGLALEFLLCVLTVNATATGRLSA